MKPALITAGDFASLRRQLSAPSALPRLVANIEQAYRAALGVEALDDDALVVATLTPAGQTDAEQAGLRVIRMCIAFREATVQDRPLWLDQLALALADADPVRVTGMSFSKGKAPGAIGEVTSYLRNERRPRETARELWERLKQLGASDEQPIYFDRVDDEMIDARTGKSISFGAFEKRLVQRKKK